MAAVDRKRQLLDRGFVRGNGDHVLAGGQVPELQLVASNRPTAADREEPLSAGEECQTVDGSRVALELADFSSRGDAPNLDGFVGAGAGQQTTIGRKRDRQHCPRVSRESELQLAVFVENQDSA